MNLGKRLRSLRTQKQMTLRELGRRTGLTASFISQAERNLASPSIDTLMRISLALRTNISYFFEETIAPEKNKIIVRKEERKQFKRKGSLARLDALTTNPQAKKMLPIMGTIKPGGKSSRYPQSHEEEEFGMILKGKAEIVIERKKYILEEGDSFYIEAYKPHYYKNIGKTELTILSIIAPPLLD